MFVLVVDDHTVFGIIWVGWFSMCCCVVRKIMIGMSTSSVFLPVFACLFVCFWLPESW